MQHAQAAIYQQHCPPFEIMNTTAADSQPGAQGQE